MAAVELSLDESSDISFKLSVHGSTSDMSNTVPTIRFLIAEKSGNIAVGFPAKSTDNGEATVSIPPLKSMGFTEEKEYSGKLEIILGNRYFAPTSMDIKFIRTAPDIEATPILRAPQEKLTTEVSEIRVNKTKQISSNTKLKQRTVTKQEINEEETQGQFELDEEIDDNDFSGIDDIQKPKIKPIHHSLKKSDEEFLEKALWEEPKYNLRSQVASQPIEKKIPAPILAQPQQNQTSIKKKKITFIDPPKKSHFI